MTESLKHFVGEKYLNLETYRKSGTPVRTPVWFAAEDGALYVYSLAGAGKVKRIRNNQRVRIVPCTVRGRPKGDWVEARARIVEQAEAEYGHRLLNKKYPLKRIGDWFSRLRRRKQAVIAITV